MVQKPAFPTILGNASYQSLPFQSHCHGRFAGEEEEGESGSARTRRGAPTAEPLLRLALQLQVQRGLEVYLQHTQNIWHHFQV